MDARKINIPHTNLCLRIRTHTSYVQFITPNQDGIGEVIWDYRYEDAQEILVALMDGLEEIARLKEYA